MIATWPSAPLEQFASKGVLRRHERGETLDLNAASEADWIMIHAGAVVLSSRIGQETSIPTAVLWRGDVIGALSPVGARVSRYDVSTLVETTLLHVPKALIDKNDWRDCEALVHDTADRIQEQIAIRLAGDGLQRLMGVLGVLARALHPRDPFTRSASGLSLPVKQGELAEFAGLSRRQVWIYLGRLAELGWVQTSRTSVTLTGSAAWFRLVPELRSRGLDCIATIEGCDETLARLALAE